MSLMIRNESTLLSLRPTLSLPDNDNTSTIEKFQNATLRPILKMQNDLLVTLVNDAPHFNQIAHHVSTADEYKSEVITFLKQQTTIKNQIIGLVIAHFTMEEYAMYAPHRNELNKRIVQMAGERVALWK